MEKRHLDIIRSYAQIFSRQLRTEGIWLEREDLEGEFGVSYANAKKMYSEDRNVKFETYFITAITNRFMDIRAKLIYESKGKANWVSLQSEEMDTEMMMNDFDRNIVVNEVLDGLTAKERLILSEVMNPSAEVKSKIQQGVTGRKYTAQLHKSIALVHNFHHNEVRYRMDKIRDKVKKSVAKSST